MNADDPTISALRKHNGCAWTVLVAVFIVVTGIAIVLIVVAVDSSDEQSVAKHFAQVIHELAPSTRMVDLSCEPGSSPPTVLLIEDRAAVIARLYRGQWHRQPFGGFRKVVGGWQARVFVGTGAVDVTEIDVTDDDELDCTDLKVSLRSDGVRVRGR